jgi:hypothetical protein
MVTGAARRRRRRWPRVKSTPNLERAAKDPERDMSAIDESLDVDQPDRLLVSALKYWEVERDLIEERLATRSATAAS